MEQKREVTDAVAEIQWTYSLAFPWALESIPSPAKNRAVGFKLNEGKTTVFRVLDA